MSEITFCPPQGDINSAPSEEDLRCIFFESKPEYWLDGSGDAGLHRDSEGTNMIFHYVSRYGFCSLFEGTASPPSLVLVDNSFGDEIVSVELSGNLFLMPRSYLVNTEAAFRAAARYLKDGSLDSEHIWVAFNARLEGDE